MQMHKAECTGNSLELRIEHRVLSITKGILALALAAGGVAMLAIGLLRTRSTLTVEVDGQRYPVRTHATTVGTALREAGFELYPEDRISLGLGTRLQTGMLVRIQRAVPVTLAADGRTRQVRTHAETVGELLAEAGVEIGPGDEIWLDGELVTEGAPLVDQDWAASWRLESGGTGGLPAAAETGPDPIFARGSLAELLDPDVVVLRATTLTIDDDGTLSTVHTMATTIGQVLEERGMILYLADQITPGLEDAVQPGMLVSIRRSVPVRIEVDGRVIHTRTLAADVAGVLGQEGIALVGQDSCEPGLSSPIRFGMTIRVTRVREELIVDLDPIPFKTVWIADPTLEIDSQRVAQQGQPGMTKQRYRARYEDGQEVDRFLEDVWTEQVPITKTLAYGTKIVVRTVDTPDGPIEYWRRIRVYTTSYTAASSGKARTHPRYGYTRLGWRLTKGIVAVDPTVIPLRTKMYVPGYGFATAGDTGGGVKGKFVDLGFDEWNYQSWHWWTDIYLLTPVPRVSEIRWILPDYPKYPDRKHK